MAVFDESKVINTLHKDKAEVGKRYYYADYISILKQRVEHDDSLSMSKLIRITGDADCCFLIDGFKFALLYPYEEPSKKRMTNNQLAEWIAKGNGKYTTESCSLAYSEYNYFKIKADEEVPSDHMICYWGSDEWIEPTVDVYLRDCK